MKIFCPLLFLLFLDFSSNAKEFRSLIFDKTGRQIPISKIIFQKLGVKTYSNDSIFIEYMDSIKKVNHKFRLLHLVTGNSYDYSVDSILKKELFQYCSPFNVFNLGHNTVEGMQIPVSFSYIKSDSTGKAWELSPAFKYAMSRKMLDSDIQFWHRLNGLNRSVFKIGMGSGVVDFNEKSSFSEMINATYILYFEQNFKKYYHRNYINLAYKQDIFNGFNAELSMLYRDSRAEINRTDFKFINHKNRVFTPNIPQNSEIGNDLFIDRQEAIIDLKLEYTPKYRYSIRNHVKRYVVSKYPTFTFNYRKSLPNIFNSDGQFDYAEFGIRQKLNVGISDQFSYQLNTGGFITNQRVFFESYRHFDSHNTTLVVRNLTNTFRLLPFYEYSTSTKFVEAHANWDSRKLILKQLPFLVNTSLVECLYFNYLSTDRMPNYFELGYGLKNIFLLTSIEAVAGFKNGKYDSAGIKLILNLP